MKKIIALILTMSMLISLANGSIFARETVTPQKVDVGVNKKLLPMTSEDTAQLMNNPDRGFRWEIWFDIGAISQLSSFTAMKNAALSQIAFYPDVDTPIKLIQSYMVINAWHTSDISSQGLQAVQAVAAALREKNMKALVRFVYDTIMYDPEHAATQTIILRHIEQLTPILATFKDDIHTVQAGFLGAWAEWHTLVYPVDKATAIDKIAHDLLPDDIYLQTRLPCYKRLISATDPVYNRIGIHNDAFFGKNPDKRSGSPIPADEAMYDGTMSWLQLTEEAAYTPQDGELFWSDTVDAEQNWADGYESIFQFSEHRFTSFSALHGHYDWQDRSDTTMGRWMNQSITNNWLNQNNVIGSPSWFKDKNGQDVARNVYEFVSEHLGYYVELQSVKVTGESKPGATVNVSVPLVNYGFSAAFNMHSGFAILDETNNVVSTVVAGDPKTWYSRSPDDYNDDTLLTHTVSASVKLPNKPGRYKIAFYLKNSRDDFARVANNIEMAGGYQILHTFDVSPLVSYPGDTATINQYQLFDGMALNQEIATGNSNAWLLLGSSNTRSALSIQPVQSLTGAYDYPMLRVDTVSDTTPVTSADRWSGINRVGVEFNTAADSNPNKIYQDLTGTDAVMFYVKMPNTPSDNNITFQIRTVSLDAQGGITGSNWPAISQGKPCYTLAKGGTTWVSKTCNGYNDFTMASGFEGWVRVPLTSFDRNAAYNWVNEIIIDFKDFGGIYGPAYFGAPMVATNSILSKEKAVIDNREYIQNLFTGGIMSGLVDNNGLSTFNQYQLVDGMTLNREIDLGNPGAWLLLGSSNTRSTLSIQPVQSITGVYEYPMLRVDTVSDTTPVTGADRWSSTNRVGVEFNTAADGNSNPIYQDFTVADAVMFYVKMPNTPTDNHITFQIRTVSLDAQGDIIGSNWPVIPQGRPCYTLANGATTWASKTCNGYNDFTMTSGFEGWVRIPLTSFDRNVTFNWINEILIDFKDFGGTYGPVYFGAPMVATNNVKSVGEAVIDNRRCTQDLFTGEIVSGTGYTSGLSTTNQYQLFNGMTLNQEIATSNMAAWLLLGSSNTRSALSIQPVSSITGAYDYPMLQVDTVSDTTPVTGADRWSSINRVGVEFNTAADANPNKIYQDLTGADAVMFYVKMPNTPSDNHITFQIRTVSLDAQGGITGSNWPVIQQGRPCYTLAKGGTEWASKTCNGYNDFTMASGFEGWVRIPLTSFDRNVAYNLINEIIIDFKDFGGTYGPVYFGAPMVATNNVMSRDATVIDNRQLIQNLFTGKVDTGSQSTFDQYQLFNGMTLNQEIATGNMGAWLLLGSSNTRSALSIQPVQSIAGVYDYPMLRVDTVSDTTPVTGADRWSGTNRVGVEFNTAYYSNPNKIYQDLTGADAVMFYIKMPNTPSDNHITFRIRTVSLDAQGDITDSDWPNIQQGRPCYTLANGATTWASKTCNGYNDFTMTSGFEGWVRIPLTSFDYKVRYNWLNEITIDFKDFGGTYGPVYFGAPMVATNDIMTEDKAVIDCRQYTQHLSTGAVDTSGLSTVNQYQLFDGMTQNQEISTGNMSAWLLLGSSNTRSALSIQPVQSLTGAYDYPMLRVDTVSDTTPVTGADRWSGTNRVGVEFNTAAAGNSNPIYQDLTGADAVMVYVKMPDTPSDNHITFQIRTVSLDAQGSITGSNWPVISQGRPCYTLAKGGTTWASTNCNGYNDFTLASGFEGWVRIPLTSFDRNVVYNWVNEIVIDFKDFGGTYGPAYFGAPMVATNNIMSKDEAVIDNRQYTQNLFTFP